MFGKSKISLKINAIEKLMKAILSESMIEFISSFMNYL